MKSFNQKSPYPSIIMAVLCTVIIAVSWRPSANPDIFGFSYIRFGGIMAMLVLIIYFFLSTKLPNLRAINNYVLFCFLVGSVAVEIILRVNSRYIPDRHLKILPYKAGQKLAADRGLFTTNQISGEGINFSWKPGTKFKERPWLIIDEHGFENDVPLGKKVETILIGASVIAATTAKDNFADLFRQDDITAYAIALGGPFGPQQYLGAYKKYIIDRKVLHRIVFILVVMPNELQKAFATQTVIAKNGTFRDLFQTRVLPSSFTNNYEPWVYSIYSKLPNIVVPFVQQKLSRKNNSVIRVKFHYGTIQLAGAQFIQHTSENGWPPFSASISEIIRLAKNVGAHPVLINYPRTHLMVLPYIKGLVSEKKSLTNYYRSINQRLSKFAENRGAEYLDLVPILQNILPDKQYMLELGEYHLNQEGIKIIYPYLRSIVKRRRSGK